MRLRKLRDKLASAIMMWLMTNDAAATGPKYLTTKIVERKVQSKPTHYGMTRAGYTKRSGAPTSYFIRLDGEKRWRRLMVWCFSNSGTCFVRVAGESLIVREDSLPVVSQ